MNRSTAKLAGAIVAWSNGAWAQIATDGTTGPAVSIGGPNYSITAGLGTQRGSNLFHSFSRFNVAAGESATFNGPTSVARVLARVTGGEVSNVNGTIRCTIPNADMYLINPAGIVFGPGAQLDLSGSFVATTADLARLADGGQFSAASPPDDVLTSAPPSAFGFLSAQPGEIVIRGDVQGQTRTILATPPGKALAVVGGNVSASLATLAADGGRVHIVSVGSSGELVGDVAAPDVELGTDSFAALGQVELNDSTNVQANAPIDAGAPPGRISVIADSLIMQGRALLGVFAVDADSPQPGILVKLRGMLAMTEAANINSGAFGAGAAGDIDVQADSIVMANTEGVGFSAIDAFTFASGKGGDIRIGARSIDIGARAGTSTAAAADGNAGNLTVQADELSVHDIGGRIQSQTIPNSSGNSGRVRIRASHVRVTSGGLISSLTAGLGVAGDLDIEAQSAVFDGEGTRVSADGAESPEQIGLTVKTDELTLSNGAIMNATSFFGPSGRVTIQARRIVLSDASIQASSLFDGGGGTITITAERLSMETADKTADGSGANIFSDTFGSGPGGNIRIDVDQLSMLNGDIGSGTGDPLGGQFLPDGGPGGDIEINAEALRMSGLSNISSATIGSAGKAGTVRINARRIVMSDMAGISSPSAGLPTDNRGGPGGDVIVRARRIEFAGGGGIFSSSNSGGDGGSVQVDADQVNLAGSGPAAKSPTGIFARTVPSLERSDPAQVLSDPHGNAGTVSVNASALRLSNAALISSESLTTGDAGSVVISADQITLQSGGRIATSGGSFANGGEISITATRFLDLSASSITAQAANTGSFTKDGGNVNLRVGERVYLLNSRLTAEAGNDGGNISIDPIAVVLNRSQIAANAVQGDGGDISVTAQVFLTSDSQVSASSEFGLSGTINISAPEVDVSAALMPLRADLASAAARLQEACARRFESLSSFIVTPRGGLPLEPAQAMPAFPDDSPSGAARSGAELSPE